MRNRVFFIFLWSLLLFDIVRLKWWWLKWCWCLLCANARAHIVLFCILCCSSHIHRYFLGWKKSITIVQIFVIPFRFWSCFCCCCYCFRLYFSFLGGHQCQMATIAQAIAKTNIRVDCRQKTHIKRIWAKEYNYVHIGREGEIYFIWSFSLFFVYIFLLFVTFKNHLPLIALSFVRKWMWISSVFELDYCDYAVVVAVAVSLLHCML